MKQRTQVQPGEAIQPYLIYTSTDIATMLNVEVQTIQRYIRRGKIKAIKFGKWYRISGADLLDFLNMGKVKNSALALEKALVILDLYKTPGFSSTSIDPSESEFNGQAADKIKEIYNSSSTRAELLINIAHYIFKVTGFTFDLKDLNQKFLGDKTS